MIIKCCKTTTNDCACTYRFITIGGKTPVCGCMHRVGLPAANTPREETPFSVRLNSSSACLFSSLHRLSDFNTYCSTADGMEIQQPDSLCARLFPLLLRTVPRTVPETTFSSRQGHGKVANWTFGVKRRQLISKLKWRWTNQEDELVIGMCTVAQFLISVSLFACCSFTGLQKASLRRATYVVFNGLRLFKIFLIGYYSLIYSLFIRKLVFLFSLLLVIIQFPLIYVYIAFH